MPQGDLLLEKATDCKALRLDHESAHAEFLAGGRLPHYGTHGAR